jgi:phage terminase large subunit-like protein
MSQVEGAVDYLASPLAKFRPWVGPDDGRSPQQEFLRAAATHQTRIFRAGNQSGKTMISCVDAVLRCTGWHPFARHRPPVRGWLVALDWEFGVGQVLWPTMKEWIPMAEVSSILWYRNASPEIPAVINFKNGSRLEFKSADSGRQKFQGAPLHFVGVDEEIPADIVEECGARLVRHGGDFWAALTPIRRERWVLEKESERSSIVIRSSMSQAAKAGILDDTAVIDYLDTLPANQRRVREMGDFAALEGLVYPDFTRDTHILRPRDHELVTKEGEALYPWPIPDHWGRWGAIDFGYSHPTAVVVGAKDPVHGRLIISMVPYATSVRSSVWGEVLNEILPSLRSPMAADHARMEREELRAKGVDTVPADKEVVLGLEAVGRWMKVQADGFPRILLVVQEDSPPYHPTIGRYDAEFLARELEMYRYPESKSRLVNDGADLPLKKDDHACDALRYLIMQLDKFCGIPSVPRSLKTEKDEMWNYIALKEPTSWR